MPSLMDMMGISVNRPDRLDSETTQKATKIHTSCSSLMVQYQLNSTQLLQGSYSLGAITIGNTQRILDYHALMLKQERFVKRAEQLQQNISTDPSLKNRLSGEARNQYDLDIDKVNAIADGDVSPKSDSTAFDFCTASQNIQDRWQHLNSQSHDLMNSRARGDLKMLNSPDNLRKLESAEWSADMWLVLCSNITPLGMLDAPRIIENTNVQ